jgi:hypothetical protein
VFVFPVAAGAKTIGVLAFNCQDARQPEERLLQTVRVIGSHVGQFLQRQQAEQDLRVHLRYQETLARFGETALGRREPDELLATRCRPCSKPCAPTWSRISSVAGDRGELIVRGLAGADAGPRQGVATAAMATPWTVCSNAATS